MLIRGKFAALLVVSLALLAGCSGDQSGDQPSKKESGKTEKAAGQRSARPAKQKPRMMIALGTISNVKAENDRIYLRPTQGNKVTGFRIVDESRITINGTRAGLADVEKGQQAKIEYLTGKNLGRVQTIAVFGSVGGSGEKTGG